jgi:hypothetical protein
MQPYGNVTSAWQPGGLFTPAQRRRIERWQRHWKGHGYHLVFTTRALGELARLPRSCSRAPSARRTRTRAGCASRDGPDLSDDEEPPPKQLDLLDAAVLTLGWVRA